MDDEVYADCFKNAAEGHAVYANISGDKMKPGSCGYFDNQRNWITIVQTSDPETLKKAGLTPLTGVDYEPEPGSRSFGPRWSYQVIGKTAKADVNTTIPGAPVGGGFVLSFTCETERGAVLVSDGDVTCRKAFPAKQYRAWMGENLQQVLELQLADEKIIKEKGVWIVTKTHTAKKRALAVLKSQGSQVSFGINVEAPNIATVSPLVGWWKSAQSNSGWITDKNAALQEENGVVLFMSGIYWKPRGFLSKWFDIVEDLKNQRFLGGEGEGAGIPIYLKVTSPQPGKEYLRLRPYRFGEPDGLEDMKVYDSNEPEEVSEDEDNDEGEGEDFDEDKENSDENPHK